MAFFFYYFLLNLAISNGTELLGWQNGFEQEINLMVEVKLSKEAAT